MSSSRCKCAVVWCGVCGVCTGARSQSGTAGSTALTWQAMCCGHEGSYRCDRTVALVPRRRHVDILVQRHQHHPQFSHPPRLELLLKFLYNEPQPDLAKLAIADLFPLAEAAHKYRVYAVISSCKSTLRPLTAHSLPMCGAQMDGPLTRQRGSPSLPR
ncbi:hypothetical protein ARMGADRAFT_483990 [Armillaria gallica]|uniref:BTB domain-containing protein n=1 Tax=Armillaria gallica TaxID=47427 RepID=A0A2H3DXY9_ARMGA|nr:hypothetical protein ARMGADRAFT_483990 [Armillaria gallica]